MPTTTKADLSLHSTPSTVRLYSAYAVNMRDMRLALKRIALRVLEGEETPPRSVPLDRYGEMCLEAKIQGCEKVLISQEKRTIYVQAIDPDGALYNYSAPLPPEWPRA